MLIAKLFCLENSVSKDEIIQKLNENEYSDVVGFGFEIINDDDSNFQFEFIERVVSTQEIETIEGESTEIEAVSYIKTTFLVRFNTSIALIVLNPPRSINYSLLMVKECIFGGQKIEQLSIDLKNCINYFSERFELSLKILSISNIQCDNYTIAKTKLISTKCLLKYFKDTYQETVARVDMLKGSLGEFELELTNTGRLRIRKKYLNNILLILDGFNR